MALSLSEGMWAFFQILRNMGPRYAWFRLWYEVRRKTGLLRAAFPTSPPFERWISVEKWRELPVSFFFESKNSLLSFSKVDPSPKLQQQIAEYQSGNILFFSAKYYQVKDWLVNPSNGYRYDATRHWTQIPDFSPTAGDIKYVWEKSRFAFLYPLIRYDLSTQTDFSDTVFSEIDSWIAANPVNCGPNWRCSQEMSLKVLNWTFALHYYKHSPALNTERFERIMHIIYWQMRHVEANIDFSRIAVRNNHAITETLTLYLVGLLYPYFPESERWKAKGKKWFEEEIAYQIYEDGTFLQFSMNYHRVVVQLLTWGIRLAYLNQERFSEIVYERAQKSLAFLEACQDDITGWLPNYGNNDGALFFPLSDAHFRDYRPQLAALAAVLGQQRENTEEAFWYGVKASELPKNDAPKIFLQHFDNGGYYSFKEENVLTFIRCGAYKNRPFQADNLHLDIWVKGENILRDAGSYLYNTDEQWIKYFAGTASHNTLMLDTYDQMQKGPRFVWYHWVKKAKGQWTSTNSSVVIFEGYIHAFGQLGKNIIHRRRVTKTKGQLHWIVEDWLENAPVGLPMHQIWHPSPNFMTDFSMKVFDEKEQEVRLSLSEGWYSSHYSEKQQAQRWVYTTYGRYLKAEIVEVPKVSILD